MEIHPIRVGRLSASIDGGPFEAEPTLTYLLPDQATSRLTSILAPYGQHGSFYLDNFLATFSPWTVACLDREYALAAHILSTRPSRDEIGFAPYKRAIASGPVAAYPMVGAVFIRSIGSLRQAADQSHIFQGFLSDLEYVADVDHCIYFPDSMSDTWTAEAEAKDPANYEAC